MYGYRKSRSVIAALVVGLCAALFSVSSLAITIDVGPSDYRNWGTGTNTHTGGGIRSTTGQTVRMPPLNTTLNVNRNAVIPYNSLANGMRNFVRINPASVAASAAVTGLFLAVDWVFDQELGEWVQIDEDTVPPVVGTGWSSGAMGANCPVVNLPSPAAACQALADCRHNPVVNSVTRISSTSYRCDLSYPGNTFTPTVSSPGVQCLEGYYLSADESECLALVPFPPDFGKLQSHLPNADPNQVGTAGHDTQRMIGNSLPGYSDQTMTGPSSISGDTTTSTTTDPSTGQSTITETSTTTNISYGDTTITTTTTTTTTNYNSDGSVSSETVTETTPGQETISGTTSSWPGFCEWAVVVCNWLDWTKEGWPEEEPELPQVVDFTPDGDFQVGGPGSCPAPYILSIGWLINQAFEVSYQPFCDFALIVNPLFLAFCYLVAGVLTVRSL